MVADLVRAAFGVLDERITPTAFDRTKASGRVADVVRAFGSISYVQDCVMVGSFARSTAIRQFSDVDVLLLVSSVDDCFVSPASLLDRVAQECRTFASEVSVGRNAITLGYEDWPDVDLIPGIRESVDNVAEPAYRIPSGADSTWLAYDPAALNREIKARSQSLGEEFKSLIRSVKWWNENSGPGVDSYFVEAAACAAFGVQLPSYPKAIAMLLEALQDIVPKGDETAIHTEDHVGVNEAVSIANQAAHLDLEGPAGLREASLLWRRLFGNEFPLVAA